MDRKIIKVGTSAAVILPQELLKQEGVRIGDTVHVQIERASARKTRVQKSAGVRPEIMEIAEQVIKEYRPLLKKLADA